MYSIFKLLLVLKLTLILLFLTTGMGNVSEVLDYTSIPLQVIDNKITVPAIQTDHSEQIVQVCPDKNSLSDLRLYIEL